MKRREADEQAAGGAEEQDGTPLSPGRADVHRGSLPESWGFCPGLIEAQPLHRPDGGVLRLGCLGDPDELRSHRREADRGDAAAALAFCDRRPRTGRRSTLRRERRAARSQPPARRCGPRQSSATRTAAPSRWTLRRSSTLNHMPGCCGAVARPARIVEGAVGRGGVVAGRGIPGDVGHERARLRALRAPRPSTTCRGPRFPCGRGRRPLLSRPTTSCRRRCG